MTTIEIAGSGLLPGMAVQATVTGHEPWGVFAVIRGFEDLPASVDANAMDSSSNAVRALPEEFPAIGAELDMVVQQLRGFRPPGRIRLSMRSADLECMRWRCDFCGLPTRLSPGGDGLSLEVRGTGGPGRTSLTGHRECVAAALHDSSLERPRILRVVGGDEDG
ncbi:MAG: hypothetical protein ACRD0P_23845 [Stackebrandtia sp.]